MAERLRQGLGHNAVVLAAGELVDLGLLPDVPRLLERVGEVVALALTERFPLEDPDMLYEHGGVHPEKMLIPWPHGSRYETRWRCRTSELTTERPR